MHNFKLHVPADQLNYINYVHNKFVTTYILCNKNYGLFVLLQNALFSMFLKVYSATKYDHSAMHSNDMIRQRSLWFSLYLFLVQLPHQHLKTFLQFNDLLRQNNVISRDQCSVCHLATEFHLAWFRSA
jgi:hypothetical protein